MSGLNDRFMFLPTKDHQFLFCMICLTDVKERYENFKIQKNNIPELVLYDAITPYVENFHEQCSKITFHEDLNNQKGRKALWLSNINVFKYFLTTECKYLVVVQDDAVVPNNLIDILNNNYINHTDFLKLGGVRLGQFASCNLYNKFCVKNILDSIETYPIDRGLDHYISNIDPTGKRQHVPHNLHSSLPGLPKTLTTVNSAISQNSMRIKYNKTEYKC